MKRVAALAGLGLMASIAGASAQEGVFMKDMLSSLGLIPGDKAPIDYRERAPLVVPPRLDLRQPVSGAALEANPQWPADHDVVRERRRQREAAIPEAERERRRMNDNNPRVSVDEIRAGRRPGAAAGQGPAPNRPDGGREATWVHPDILRSQGVRPDKEFESADDPGRQYLTEPPSGLRRPDSRAPIRVTRELPRDMEREEADPNVFNRQQAERNRR